MENWFSYPVISYLQNFTLSFFGLEISEKKEQKCNMEQI